MYRFYPQIAKIIEIIKSNEMGKLISMESVYGVNLLYKKKFFIFNKKKKD
jgi:predicted dehydrogenase